MKKFNPETIPALGFYIYALVDPRKSPNDPRRFFYVGKGKGHRCFQHAQLEIRWNRGEDPNPKLGRIRTIRRETGAPPPILIIVHNLSEETAIWVEGVLISVLRTDGNLVGGKYSSNYCLKIGEIEGRYAKPLQESQLRRCVLLVNLNGGEELPPYPAIAPHDLPRRVLRYWVIKAEKAKGVDFVAGVYGQLVRVVFRVHKDSKGNAKFRRFNCGRMKNGARKIKTGFLGDRCPELERIWVNHRIVDKHGTLLTKFARQQGWKLVGGRAR